MSDPILEQLQQHADRLSAEVTRKLENARQYASSSTALITALERVEAAAKTLSKAAHAPGEGNPSHD